MRSVLGLLAIGVGILWSWPNGASGADFTIWLRELQREAVAAGISPAVVEQALAGIELNARVLELDRSQPEDKLTLASYLDRVLTPSRIAEGKRKLAENRRLLERVGKAYGVQPRFIVALWGVESLYGERTGKFNVIECLATLAYDGRRSAFFRKELLTALRILDEEGMTAARMTGSWAGAMGQSQFMPTSYERFAADGDGDHKRDIWANRADVFASIANYLKHAKWSDDQTWGRQVRLPAKFDLAHAKSRKLQPLHHWQKLGVRRLDGGALPTRNDVKARLIVPDGPGGAAYLVYANYNSLLRWNASTFFAVTVGSLADAIGG